MKTGFFARLERCQTWPQMQMLLNEAIRVLESNEYKDLLEAAQRKIAQLNYAAVGPQKARHL